MDRLRPSVTAQENVIPRYLIMSISFDVQVVVAPTTSGRPIASSSTIHTSVAQAARAVKQNCEVRLASLMTGFCTPDCDEFAQRMPNNNLSPANVALRSARLRMVCTSCVALAYT